MTEKNYAYYNVSSGLIENVICIDDDVASALSWPNGYAIVDMPNDLQGLWSICGIGWSYVNGEFLEPSRPESVQNVNEQSDIINSSPTLT